MCCDVKVLHHVYILAQLRQRSLVAGKRRGARQPATLGGAGGKAADKAAAQAGRTYRWARGDRRGCNGVRRADEEEGGGGAARKTW